MTDADAVRRVALALPRVYEREVRGRWKLKVKQIVFVAFSRDEQDMGFGFPKAEREGLVASDPQTFYLPGPADMRYQWVCAHLAKLDEQEMAELVTDAWRMCTPQMLHDLPEMPAPTARAWDLVEKQEWHDVRPLLHPYLHFHDGDISLRGRDKVIAYLRAHPTPKPPTEVEVRDGQLYRWRRSRRQFARGAPW
ncbi:MAG: MmcQ/YjbR family DNA-binding protein [Nocardioides sp.]|nr:MmcQ/YjbR family DNA-binding protein [Nocardioides sp.]